MVLENLFHSIKARTTNRRRPQSAIPSFRFEDAESLHTEAGTPCPSLRPLSRQQTSVADSAPPKRAKSIRFPLPVFSARSRRSEQLERSTLVSSARSRRSVHISDPTPATREPLNFGYTPPGLATQNTNATPQSATSPDALRTQEESTFNKALNILSQAQRSRSLRDILLPPVPTLKPITINSLTAAGNSSVQIGPTPVRQRYSGQSREHYQRHSMGIDCQPHRRPVAGVSGPVITPLEEMKFDPKAPLADPEMHPRARVALTARYQSKFSFNFEPVSGYGVHDYDFLWASPMELERRVLGDIIWARERFGQANRDEPTDEELIEFYDAQEFDPEKVAMEMREM